MVMTSVIDDRFFGSEKSFRNEYGKGENLKQLRERIKSVFTRTLRKDGEGSSHHGKQHWQA